MAKGRGQNIGGAFFDIGGDNSGLKETLDDSMRSVTSTVTAMAAVGRGGAGALGGAMAALGPLAGVAGLGIGAGKAMEASIEGHAAWSDLAKQLGRQGAGGEQFDKMVGLIREQTRGLPGVTIGDLRPVLTEAFRQGGISPDDTESIRQLLEMTVGGALVSGKEMPEVGSAVIQAIAKGEMEGLAGVFQGMQQDPRFAQENLARAGRQARAAIDVERADMGVWRRLHRDASDLADTFSIMNKNMAGVGGGLTYPELVNVSNVAYGAATGMGARERREALGSPFQDNPAWDTARGFESEDVTRQQAVEDLWNPQELPGWRTRPPLALEEKIPPRMGPEPQTGTVGAAGTDEIIRALNEIVRNTQKTQPGEAVDRAMNFMWEGGRLDELVGPVE